MNTSEKLLDAAEYRMRRGGYNSVSYRDLANDLDIKSSSVHYHFPQKEKLAVALIERYSTRMFEQLQKKAAKAKNPTEKLKAFGATYESALKKDGAVCLCGLLGSEMAGLPETVQDAVQVFFNANIDWVEQVLPDSISKTERRKKAGSLVAAHQGAMMLAVGLKDFKIFGGISENLISCLLLEDS